MIKYLTNVISRALGFTKTESRGTLVLILIITLLIFVTQTRIHYLKSQPQILADSSAIEWINQVKASYELKKTEEKNEPEQVSKNLPIRSVVGNKPMDFSKKTESKEHSIIPRDINTATAEELQEIYGIGPAFSDRIIKYRDLLGGFSDSTQLNEVYGLKPEIISNLLKSFQIQSPVNSINLNTDSIQHLARHPYVSYDLARVIINYRKEHGDFHNVNELLKIKAMDHATFMRLKPYLE
ncbi:helix-hairpin-helix domain-containing protein [Ekhidna sp.]|uniref:ComEA family DNA-binding protein n=1 Tax=Ekhidna sp. TaxID=2608089 RepID=UPI003298699B